MTDLLSAIVTKCRNRPVCTLFCVMSGFAGVAYPVVWLATVVLVGLILHEEIVAVAAQTT